jgi:hypothetical protein
MNKTITISALLLIAPLTASAGEAENILSCIQSVNAYTGKSVDEFDVRYEGRILGFSSAEWPGIGCEVSLASVYNLTVDGRQYIFEGFSGRQAKTAYESLERETKEAISLLESRAQLLERRLEDARSTLKFPNPDIEAVQKGIRYGIGRATGD